MSKCLIISGGDFTPGLFNSNFIKSLDYSYVYAADKGIIYAHKMGIVPDAVIGDFDSLSDYVDETSDTDDHESISVDKYLDLATNVVSNLFGEDSKNIQILTHPVRKDDTDTMLAIKHAINNGFTHIYIICALGGRLDHTIANIQSMHYAIENNVTCNIYSDSEHLSIIKGPANIKVTSKPLYSLSLYSLTNECTGLSISGTKYDVNDITISNSFPLAYGNTIIKEQAEISIKTGTLLISESKH